MESFNKQTRKRIYVIGLLLLEVVFLTLTYKSLNNKEIALDEVNILNKNSKMFAMYVKDANGEYEEYTENSFPDSYYKLNNTLTGCNDINGNPVEVVINYENGSVEVKTNKTVYCYLYFDFYLTARGVSYTNANYTECEESQCAIDELYASIDETTSILTSGLNTEYEAGLRRYQGLLADNYICFGTTDRDTCVSDTDKYMYRIVGIDVNNKMKLIKKEALNTAYAWHNNSTTNTEWPDSDLYSGLNGSYFLTNNYYVPSTWEDRIQSVDWKYGNLTTNGSNLTDITNEELGFSNSVNAKIGLLYIHDLAYGFKEGKNCSAAGICKTSWLNLTRKGNDPEAPERNFEWTITRYPFLLYMQTYALKGDIVKAETAQAYNLFSVRPVFYLNSSQSIASGGGTLNNPFILN